MRTAVLAGSLFVAATAFAQDFADYPRTLFTVEMLKLGELASDCQAELLQAEISDIRTMKAWGSRCQLWEAYHEQVINSMPNLRAWFDFHWATGHIDHDNSLMVKQVLDLDIEVMKAQLKLLMDERR